MAHVPYDPVPTVSPSGPAGEFLNANASPADFGGLIGAATQKLGQGAGELGNALATNAVDLQVRQNQIVTSDAFNKFQNAALNITSGDPNDPSKKGFLATEGKETQTAYPAYIGNLEQARQDILSGLSNDAQKIAFEDASRRLQTNTLDTMRAHFIQQMRVYGVATNQAAMDTSARAVGADPATDQTFNDNLAQVRMHAVQMVQNSGNESDPVILHDTIVKAEQKLILARVQALQAQDPVNGATNALTWLKSGLIPDTPVAGKPQTFSSVESHLSPELMEQLNTHFAAVASRASVAEGAATVIGGGLSATPPASRGAATNMAWSRIVQQEHGEDTQGGALVSPKGATGASQMLISTAQETAQKHGVPYDPALIQPGPNYDSSYSKMLGRLHFGDLVQKYNGNTTLASAAYNAGEGRVDEWLQQNGDPRSGKISDAAWAAKIPIDETRDYVTNVARPGGGSTGGAGGSAPAQTPPLMVGDSITEGVKRIAGTSGFTRIGASPSAILATIHTIPDDQVKGKDIVLSGGASNNPAEVNLVADQVDALKAKGAKSITIVGVGDRPDFAAAGLNTTLASIAQKSGASFLPIPPAMLQADHVHPHFAAFTPVVLSSRPQTTAAASPQAGGPAPGFDGAGRPLPVGWSTDGAQPSAQPAVVQPGVQPPGTPQTQAPDAGAQQHSPAPYSIEMGMITRAWQEAQARFPNRPDLQKQLVNEVYEHIQQTNILQQKYEMEQQKAQRDAQNGLMNGVITTLNQDPSKFDPRALDAKDAQGNYVLLPEQRENLMRYSKQRLTESGVEDTAPYGKGYSQAYKDIFAEPGDPNKINDLNDILKRGGPDGDLSGIGVEKLAKVFQLSRKNPDERAVDQTAASFLGYAKNKLSFEQDTGPVKIRDPKGEAIFNAQFVPRFEAGLAAAKATGNPADVWKYLQQDNIDKLIQGLRSPADMAKDRLSATGQLAPMDVDKPGAPLPVPPADILPPAQKDGQSAPAETKPVHINSGEWYSIINAPPVAENGSPYTHAAWAEVMKRLMADPARVGPWFDQRFGAAGYRADELIARLKKPDGKPAADETADGVVPGL